MYNFNELCFICFVKTDLQPLSGSINGGITYYDKLIICVSEMKFEKLNNKQLICKECCRNLDTAYSFRNKCLKSKMILTRPILEKSMTNKEQNEIGTCKNDSQQNILNNGETENNRKTDLKEESHKNEIFISKKDARNSQTTLEQAKNKTYACNICNGVFKTEKQFMKHLVIDHGQKPYVCTECDKTFTTSTILTNHMRMHSGVKPFQCTKCNKKFTVSRILIDHMRTHSGEKPYQCGVCNKAFSQSGQLSVHKRIHSGDKPRECPVCGESFIYGSSLVAHMRGHTGDKPYNCETCGKKFPSISNLKVHIRIHTGTKPFECKTCGKKFTQSGGLSTHMQIHSKK